MSTAHTTRNLHAEIATVSVLFKGEIFLLNRFQKNEFLKIKPVFYLRMAILQRCSNNVYLMHALLDACDWLSKHALFVTAAC